MSAGLGANQNWRKKEIYQILIPKTTSKFCPEYHTELLRLFSLLSYFATNGFLVAVINYLKYTNKKSKVYKI
jgi:hypothetical protein